MNGRLWSTLPDDGKKPLVLGLLNGVVYSLSKGCNIDGRKTLMPTGLAPDEVIRAVDDFFSDPTNANIPIVNALEWVTAKTAGASKAELEQTVARFRRAAASALQTK